jgi:hypothetical protein
LLATLSPETSALLLASKSNYQNLLEGNHLPGVSYPEALSTNLTSKRTSHKIAEQGRRNRINHALQEIASLLPPDFARQRQQQQQQQHQPSANNGGGSKDQGSSSSNDAPSASAASSSSPTGATGAAGPTSSSTTSSASPPASSTAPPSGPLGPVCSSKASTVEMAIEYIKALQRDLSEARQQLEVAEKKLGEQKQQQQGAGLA